ncbi:MAG: transcription termination factor NusA [Candidatus Gottesmanbacteria bacterium]
MPAIVRTEFALALNQVCTERGIDPSVVLDTIKAAILAAYRKDFGDEDIEKLDAQVDSNTGEAKIFKEGKDITPPGFGRIAAQTAKQVILQRIREAEKAAVLTDYSAKVGTIVNGMILRFDNSNIIVDIGRAEGVMPLSEQIHNEDYRINQRLTFYIEGIREGPRGSEIIVSRAHKGLVEGLFRREVPEVASGAVQLKTIAREAGNRTKIAVFSDQNGVDPVGSCVGQKGVRVQAVISELGGTEKLDIIQWNDDSASFITSSLAPAKDINVNIDKNSQTATAIVPDDQLSLAIGKNGQNVRLAAKLTGWKIDIKGKSEMESASAKATADKKVEAAKTPIAKNDSGKTTKKTSTKKITKKTTKKSDDQKTQKTRRSESQKTS